MEKNNIFDGTVGELLEIIESYDPNTPVGQIFFDLLREKKNENKNKEKRQLALELN